jgi:hypothetical protein
MNYDKIKALEASILEAVAKHDCDPKEASAFLGECFRAKRLENLNENSIKRLERCNMSLSADIRRHKTCIDNLRGYIDYLEKEKSLLQAEIDEQS